MPSDFGDESGEKFCDWLMQIGQAAGEDAMRKAATQLSLALKKTKGETPDGGTEAKWAQLHLDELTKLEGYDSIKEIIDAQLDEAGIEHQFFTDSKTNKESLLFRASDGTKVDRVFDELINNVETSFAKAKDVLSKGSEPTKTNTRETGRDSEPLEKRATRVRASSAALAAEQGRTKSPQLGRSDKLQEIKTK